MNRQIQTDSNDISQIEAICCEIPRVLAIAFFFLFILFKYDSYGPFRKFSEAESQYTKKFT